MRTARQILLGAFGVAAWWLVSCRDIPAPEGGVLSISGVLLPLPALVAGDTMRDSTGLAAPLRLIAYGANAEPADPQPTPTFVALDTFARFDGALLIAGSSPGSVRVVGGMSSFQTNPVTVKITLSPDALVAADSVTQHRTYSLVGDTVINSADLSTMVVHSGASVTGVEAVIVNYEITDAPDGNGNGPSVLLVNGRLISQRDTTDASGRAARAARLRLFAISGEEPETTAVRATASYRGQSIGAVNFLVIFSRQ